MPEIPITESSSAADTEGKSERDRPARGIGPLVELCQTLLITVLIALFGTTFVLQAYNIPSDSMSPTLLAGDHLLVNKFVFGGNGAWYEKLVPYREIRRGDLIVFRYRYEDHPDYVKRVVGMPGDRLRIVLGRVFINGKLLREPYAVHDGFNSDAGTDTFPPLDPYSIKVGLMPEWADQIENYIQDDELVVPANRYFVMGDNRDDSQDSRYWGFVDRGAVTGEPILIYWSVNASEDDYADEGFWGSTKRIGSTLIHLRSRTRWRRIFREVH
ncbi:MAG: signal peptidase I [Candidatus Acidiferrales bacterium]